MTDFSPTLKYARENEEVTLNPGLSADGNPPPTYRWRKVGLGYVSDSSDDSWRSLGRVSTADFGVYHCVAANSFGSVIIKEIRLIRARLEVVEVSAPEEALALNSTAARGQFLRLRWADRVVVDSQPPAIVKWFEKPDATSSSQWEITNALWRRGLSVQRDAVALLELSNEDNERSVKVKFENPTALISRELSPWTIKVRSRRLTGINETDPFVYFPHLKYPPFSSLGLYR